METMFRASCIYLFAAKENIEHQTTAVRRPLFLGPRNPRYGTRSDFLFIRGSRPLVGLLYQLRMMRNDCGAVDEMEWTGETEVLEEILPQSHFVYHKSHTTRD
jgi:hypothetical protein